MHGRRTSGGPHPELQEDIMITVMGASGNTGGKIAAQLLSSGQKVRVLGRNEQALAPLWQAGAEVILGDTTDTAFLTRAFTGADAVYTLLPTDRRAPDYRASQRKEGEAIAAAIRASGVKQHVVALSAVGADLADGNGVIAGLHEQEERLKAIEGINLLLLRPVSFFENFFDQIPVIKYEGMVADSVIPDLAIPMIASQDVAAAAVPALASHDWHGVIVRELLGPRDVSYREAVGILGERIGKPDLAYVQLDYPDMAAALEGAGLSASFAGRYVEMTRAFNEQTVRPLAGRTEANTTPTGFEEFAVEFARTYEAA
jgi:uncharacterized protein YbjT (DUF2867 family)